MLFDNFSFFHSRKPTIILPRRKYEWNHDLKKSFDCLTMRDEENVHFDNFSRLETLLELNGHCSIYGKRLTSLRLPKTPSSLYLNSFGLL